jgi:hypothetical protein
VRAERSDDETLLGEGIDGRGDGGQQTRQAKDNDAPFVVLAHICPA